MKKLLVSTILFLLLISGSLAAAQQVDFYKREIMLGTDTAEISDTIIFDDMPQQIKLPLLFSADNFRTSTTFTGYSCDLTEEDYGSLITCDLPKGKTGRLTLLFETSELISDIESYHHFRNTLNMPADAEKLTYTVNLKSGLVLMPENNSQPFGRYTPSDGKKGSDGRRIFVYWVRDNLTGGDSFSASVTYERPEKETSNPLQAYIFSAGAVLIIILVFIVLKQGSGGGEEESEIPKALKPDESEVMEIIEGSGGEIKQRRIVESTDFSKAKVSRLIKDLEERGLVEKEKVGRTNRISLRRGE